MSRRTSARRDGDDLTRRFLGVINTMTAGQARALMIMLENHDNPEAAYLAAFRLARALHHPPRIAVASAREWAECVGGES